MRTREISAAFFLLVISINAHAVPIEFEFDWQGENEYSLNGTFSFDDSLLGTGVITQDSLLSFSMAGFLDGGLLGTFDGIPESLLFDTVGLFFPVGVNADGSRNLQQWNFRGAGINFLSARFSQALGLDGVLIFESGFRVESGLTRADSRLTVSRVPEPGTLTLLGLGLLGLSIARRKHA